MGTPVGFAGLGAAGSGWSQGTGNAAAGEAPGPTALGVFFLLTAVDRGGLRAGLSPRRSLAAGVNVPSSCGCTAGGWLSINKNN